MAIGNGGRGRRRVRLRLRANEETWYYLSREPLGWVGPFGNAEAAFARASENGHLWRDEELR